jgi:hypothetical protein
MTERNEVVVRLSPSGQAGSWQPCRGPASHCPNDRNHSEEPE